jgi:hypothetical protein
LAAVIATGASTVVGRSASRSVLHGQSIPAA